MKKYFSLAVLLCASVLTGCDYEKNAVQDITGPVPAAGIRFFNFGVNAPGVNFYTGGTKVTAISSAACTLPPISDACLSTGVESLNGVNYGGVASGGSYSGMAPGEYTFSGKIAAATDNGLAISNASAALADGKKYSYYQSGVYNATTKKVDAFVVEDPFPADIDWSVATVRFVNAIFNANPMTLYATDATGKEFVVGGSVAYKGAGAFTTLPTAVYTLSTRYSGSSTNAMSRTLVTFVAGRVYTITARGDITVAPTTTTCLSTNVTCLDNSLNR